MKLWIDLETRSRVDLTKSGVSRYSRDPSTDVHCACYAFEGDETVHVWDRRDGLGCPRDLAGAIESGARLCAWNAPFEQNVFDNVLCARYGWPHPQIDQWWCDMAQALYAGLPASLKEASAALDIGDDSKDMTGRRVMLKMMKPNRKGEWVEDDTNYRTLIEYCQQDVRAERAISRKLPKFPDTERDIWLLDRKINMHGVPCDRILCEGALEVSQRATESLEAELEEITAGVVDSVGQVARIVKFAEDCGVHLPNLQAPTVASMLQDKTIDARVRRVLQIRAACSSAAIKKYKATVHGVDSDGFVREGFRYGKANTMRWGGAGVQFHNMARAQPDLDLVELLRQRDFESADMLYGAALIPYMKRCVRGIVAAPEGYKLVVRDFSQIECRVLNWLAGQESMLQMIREDKPVYEAMASIMYGLPIESISSTSPERQAGKAAVLGLGYQMGGAKFKITAKTMAGVDFTEDESKEVVSIYRDRNPEVKKFWYGCQRTAARAIRNPGKTFGYRAIAYKRVSDYLVCRLPSGRYIFYYKPEAKKYDGLFGEEFSLSYQEGANLRIDTYGGKLVENIVQATARDMLADAMLRADRAGLNICMHVHDEIVLLETEDEAEAAMATLTEIMNTPPDWAADCPLGSSGDIHGRYTK